LSTVDLGMGLSLPPCCPRRHNTCVADVEPALTEYGYKLRGWFPTASSSRCLPLSLLHSPSQDPDLDRDLVCHPFQRDSCNLSSSTSILTLLQETLRLTEGAAIGGIAARTGTYGGNITDHGTLIFRNCVRIQNVNGEEAGGAQP